jgi:hypothetical protein
MLSEKKKRSLNMGYLKRNISCDAYLLNELLETDAEDYINCLRMNEQTFNMLLTKVPPYIKKEYTLEGGNLTKTETYCYAEVLSNRQELRGYEVFYETISPVIRENDNGNLRSDNKGVE